jgi:hypothetical protein
VTAFVKHSGGVRNPHPGSARAGRVSGHPGEHAVDDFPTNNKAYSLLPGGHSLAIFQAWCGHSLPVGVVVHDHLPGGGGACRAWWLTWCPHRVFPDPGWPLVERGPRHSSRRPADPQRPPQFLRRIPECR